MIESTNIESQSTPLFICILANTETSLIPGISAAGKNEKYTFYTPTGDSEIISCGNILTVPIVPITPPFDTPTPAIITKAILNLTNIPYLFIDTGLVYKPHKSVPIIKINNRCGQSILSNKSVLDVKILIERGKELGKNITLRKKNDIFIIGESTPGGTTTAQAVLNLLGYKSISSSSFELNPTKLKNEVINQKFEKLGISFGDYKDNPLQAIEICGDPMMAAAVGIISGIIETSKSSKIILSGGTQMISVYCILKNLGIDIKNVSICTTKYVYEDKSCNIKELEKCLNLKLRIVNPEFELSNVAGIKRYTKGTIKEGAGAGGMIQMAFCKKINPIQIISEIENICSILKTGQK